MYIYVYIETLQIEGFISLENVKWNGVRIYMYFKIFFRSSESRVHVYMFKVLAVLVTGHDGVH